jgi:thioredoxin
MKIVSSEELEQMKLNGEKVLVDFYAEWCGPCKTLIPRLENLESKYPNIKFVKVNVDDNQTYMANLGVRSVPTVMFFDGDQKINSTTGMQSPAHYDEILSQMTGNEQ